MSNNVDRHGTADKPTTLLTTTRPLPSLRSSDLFRDGNTVQIEHENQYYLLRLTKGNKLILTK
jgi:hemin uptake protein HemP